MLHRSLPPPILSLVAPAKPLTLHLCPGIGAVSYHAAACWETYVDGDYHTSTIAKEVTLGLQAAAEGDYLLDLRTGKPALNKPEDQHSLEGIALQLAALYEWVVIRAAPTGHFRAVSNHAAVHRTWDALAQVLREATTAEDQLTPALLQFVGQQVQDPAKFLDSLRHDYLYRALVLDRYDRPLGGPGEATSYRQFASFFDKLPLWFREEAEIVPSQPGGALTLQLRGTLAPEKTDVDAIAHLMAQAVGPAAPSSEAPHFHYAATHVLDPQTGLPLTVDLTVYGRLADRYNKQYTLTITRV